MPGPGEISLCGEHVHHLAVDRDAVRAVGIASQAPDDLADAAVELCRVRLAVHHERGHGRFGVECHEAAVGKVFADRAAACRELGGDERPVHGAGDDEQIVAASPAVGEIGGGRDDQRLGLVEQLRDVLARDRSPKDALPFTVR
ncbi:hypothetical protein D3C83_14830 [compost metagenome]